MTDRTEAVQALRDAARGWRDLGAHVEEVVQTLNQEVSGVLASDWRGSGAEGFASQWAVLLGAVQEALPAFELAASDLEQAADAAEAALGGDAGADSGRESGELAGNDVSSANGTEAPGPSDSPAASSQASSVSGGESMSALDSLVSAQLSEGLSHGGQTLEVGGAAPAETTTSDESSGRGGTGGTGDSGGATGGVLPPVMRTESIVSSLGKLAATIATVFDRSGYGGAGAGVGSLPLPSSPHGSSFPRHSDGLLRESMDADPVEAGRGADDKAQDDETRDDKGTPDTEGSPIDNDDLPAPDQTPDSPSTPERDRDMDPEGVDPDPTAGDHTPRGAFG